MNLEQRELLRELASNDEFSVLNDYVQELIEGMSKELTTLPLDKPESDRQLVYVRMRIDGARKLSQLLKDGLISLRRTTKK